MSKRAAFLLLIPTFLDLLSRAFNINTLVRKSNMQVSGFMGM